MTLLKLVVANAVFWIGWEPLFGSAPHWGIILFELLVVGVAVFAVDDDPYSQGYRAAVASVEGRSKRLRF